MNLHNLTSLFSRRQPIQDDEPEIPKEVLEVLERKNKFLKNRSVRPGSPDEVIIERFDRQIKELCIKHGYPIEST